MSEKERTHEYMCEHILDEYIAGFRDSKRFCFCVDSITEFKCDNGIEVSDGIPYGCRLFFTWEALRRMFEGEEINVYHKGNVYVACRFVGSNEDLGDIERECERDGITEDDVQVTRDFLEEKELLTASTEDDEPQDSEPTERKGSDIVRECKVAIENAFSDMIWNLCEHPVRPSATIEVYMEKSRFLTVLTRFEAVYEEMEGER